MSATAYLIVVIDTPTFSLAGVDIFSETEPTLGAHRARGILLEVTTSTYDESHRLLVHEIAMSPRWAWTRPHLGRCKGEVETLLAGRGGFVAAPAPPLETCPPPPPSQSVTDRAATPAKGSYQLVELVGTKFRVVAWVTPSASGGFIFEELRADGGHGEPHYVGSSAVYQMWPCSKEVALATAWKFMGRAADLPPWAVVPPPPRPPAPIPLEGQSVGFDNSCRGRAVVSSTPSGVVVVRDVALGLVAIDMTDPTHVSALRWIESSTGTVVWERDDGLHESDTVPF